MKEMKLKDCLYVVLVFVSVAIASGVFHELGHYLICRILYGSGRCAMVFSFDTCNSVWPVCVWHPPDIAVKTAGGVFSGGLLLAIYYLIHKTAQKKEGFVASATSLIFFVLASLQITQGLQEGLLPSVYANQLSFWNVIVLVIGILTGTYLLKTVCKK